MDLMSWKYLEASCIQLNTPAAQMKRFFAFRETWSARLRNSRKVPWLLHNTHRNLQLRTFCAMRVCDPGPKWCQENAVRRREQARSVSSMLVGRLAGSRGLYPLFAQICRPQQTPHDLNMSLVARGLLLVCFFGRAIWQWKRENFDMLSKSTAMCWPRYLFGTQCGILDYK